MSDNPAEDDGAAGGGRRRRGSSFSRFMQKASAVLRRNRTKSQSGAGTGAAAALAPVGDDAAPAATTSTSGQAQTVVPEQAPIQEQPNIQGQPAITAEPAIPQQPAIQEQPAMQGEPPIQEQPAIPAQTGTQEPTTSAPTVAAVAPPIPSSEDSKTQEAEAPLREPRSPETSRESNKIQEEKARALFAKSEITLGIDEWKPPFKEDAVWVQKKVRMRIHRHCHKCQTLFGVDRQCIECGHTRCKKCPRMEMSKLQGRQGKRAVTIGEKHPEDLAVA